jgi:hypothetical protein
LASSLANFVGDENSEAGSSLLIRWPAVWQAVNMLI